MWQRRCRGIHSIYCWWWVTVVVAIEIAGLKRTQNSLKLTRSPNWNVFRVRCFHANGKCIFAPDTLTQIFRAHISAGMCFLCMYLGIFAQAFFYFSYFMCFVLELLFKLVPQSHPHESYPHTFLRIIYENSSSFNDFMILLLFVSSNPWFHDTMSMYLWIYLLSFIC